MAGRPTKYRPEFCDAVLEVMGRGLSIEAVCGKLRVARSTFDEWRQRHEELAEAVAIGVAMRTAMLEEELLDKTIPGPQVTARIFALKNAAPHEWKDRREVAAEITQTHGEPLVDRLLTLIETAKDKA